MLPSLCYSYVRRGVDCGAVRNRFRDSADRALPEGKTLIIPRLTTMHFIDSADAWCERPMGGVNLLCRAAVMARVAEKATILARLPYSSSLYAVSTGGKTYDR